MTPTQFSGHCLENWEYKIELSAEINITLSETLPISDLKQSKIGAFFLLSLLLAAIRSKLEQVAARNNSLN